MAEELDEGRVYPNLNRIQEVSLKVAVDVAAYALEHGCCALEKAPESLEEHIKKHVYNYRYD